MAKIERDGFSATIEGKSKRVTFKAAFRDSTLNADLTIPLAELVAKNLSMLAMFAPNAKVEFEEAKRELLNAIERAK